MERRTLNLAAVEWVTARVTIDYDHVDDLARDLVDGEELPLPAAVQDSQGRTYGYRGHHVALAHRVSELEFDIQSGTRQDAVRLAVAENHQAPDRRALRRSPADRVKAIDLVLRELPEEVERGVNHLVKLTGTYRKVVLERIQVAVGQGILELCEDGEGIKVCRGGKTFTQRTKVSSEQRRALDFVRYAGCRTYLTFADGRVTAATPGLVASAPLEVPFSFRPKAPDFFAAIGSRGSFAVERLPDARVVAVIQGEVSTPVKVTAEPADVVQPSGEDIDAGPDFLSTVASMADRVGQGGLLLEPGRAVAWNDHTLTSLELPQPVFAHPTRLPTSAVKAFADIKEVPERMQRDGDFLTLHFSGQRWLRFPLAQVDLRLQEEGSLQPSDRALALPSLGAALDKLANRGSVVVLHRDALETDTGARVSVPGLPEAGGPFTIGEMLRFKEFACRVEPDGPAFFDDGRGLRARLERGERLESDESDEHPDCPHCGQRMP